MGDKLKKNIVLPLLIIIFLSCSAGPLLDWSSEQEVTEITTTHGQELIDLKKALDSGAITQEEYEQLKRKIIDR